MNWIPLPSSSSSSVRIVGVKLPKRNGIAEETRRRLERTANAQVGVELDDMISEPRDDQEDDGHPYSAGASPESEAEKE